MYIFYTTAKGENMNYRINLRVFCSYIEQHSSFTKGVKDRNITINAIGLESERDFSQSSLLSVDVTHMLDRLDAMISPTILVLLMKGSTAQIMKRDSRRSVDGKYMTGLWLDATDPERATWETSERKLDALKAKQMQEIAHVDPDEQLSLFH